MSNPFDQFSTDLHSALPNGAPPPVPTNDYNPYGPPQGAGQNVYSNYSHQPPQQQQSYAPSQMNGAYGANQYGPPMQQVHQSDFASSQPYGAPPEKPHYAASGENNPFGGPPQMAPPPPPQESNPFASQALVPSTQPQQSPYALGPSLGVHSPSHQNGYGPAPPSQEQSNPFGSSEAVNPFGAPHSSVPPQSVADPWGSHSPHQQYQPPSQPDPSYGAIVPAAPQADPFSVFQSAPAPQPPQPSSMAMYGAPPSSYGNPPPHQQQPPYQTSVAPAPSGDLFGDMGFAPPVPNNPAPFPTNSDGLLDTAIVATEPGTSNRQHESDLPPGGEWYDARIFTPTLGVMFFKPQELTDSLFLNTDRETVDILAERPVVAFIVEGSSARAAGVELGHVLLKVNGVDVKNPKEASRLIKEGPRPLPLLFYVPPSDIVVAEGEHMVKYDTKDTLAPNSAKDWKPKYVVIGGIIAQPWMMNMYRSKSEYDIAVIETQARRPVSVKVKQFSLQGARIQNDWQGPQMVKYKNKLHPWKYIVILPVARNPIKISSPNLSQLKPVHEGIRRVLLSQQRDRGNNPNSAAPVRENDPYSNSGRASAAGPARAPSQHTDYNREPPAAIQSTAPPVAPQPVQDLLGFDAPAPSPVPPYGAPQPQMGYGNSPPPPNAYGGSPNQFGAPLPYGAPPPQSYGAPPQQQAYSAPAPQQGYGVPPPPQLTYGNVPPNPYGAPPPQQQYGAPPTQPYMQQPYNNY